jgi:hypothetical protein
VVSSRDTNLGSLKEFLLENTRITLHEIGNVLRIPFGLRQSILKVSVNHTQCAANLCSTPTQFVLSVNSWLKAK